jgi:hypothetical protein
MKRTKTIIMIHRPGEGRGRVIDTYSTDRDQDSGGTAAATRKQTTAP